MPKKSFSEASSLRMLTRLTNKPLESWYAASQRVKERGYTLLEVWACPVVRSSRYEVRITSDYPDARRVVVSLYELGGEICLEEQGAACAATGLTLASEWLDAREEGRPLLAPAKEPILSPELPGTPGARNSGSRKSKSNVGSLPCADAAAR